MNRVSDEYLLDRFRQIVGQRAGWCCEMPRCYASGEDLHPHHYFSRKHKSIRYDPVNGLWLCAEDHRLAHNNPKLFTEILIYYNARTQEWLDDLIIRRNQIVKFNDIYRIEWKDRLLGLKAA